MMMQCEIFLGALAPMIGDPYIYGATGANGYDCSQLVVDGLRETDIYKGLADMTARQMCHSFFKDKQIDPSCTKPGCLLFYARKGLDVSHVMVAYKRWPNGQLVLVGARGGDSTTRTYEEAYRRKAMVSVVVGDYWKSGLRVVVDPFIDEPFGGNFFQGGPYEE